MGPWSHFKLKIGFFFPRERKGNRKSLTPNYILWKVVNLHAKLSIVKSFLCRQKFPILFSILEVRSGLCYIKCQKSILMNSEYICHASHVSRTCIAYKIHLRNCLSIQLLGGKVWNFSNYKREWRLEFWKSKNFENLRILKI